MTRRNVGLRRLLRLADFLDALPRQKFDFSVITRIGGKPMAEALKARKSDCGTAGCAIGWMPAAFPRSVEWSYKWNDGTTRGRPLVRLKNAGQFPPDNFDAAEEFFGISRDDALWLFQPEGYHGGMDRFSPLEAEATPKDVARHIRKYVKRATQVARG